MYQHFLSLFLRGKEKENACKRKRNTLFICNPLDCSSPNGRTTCRFSSPPPLEGGGRISTRALRVLEIQGAGYSLKSFTAPKNNGAELLRSTNTVIANNNCSRNNLLRRVLSER